MHTSAISALRAGRPGPITLASPPKKGVTEGRGSGSVRQKSLLSGSRINVFLRVIARMKPGVTLKEDNDGVASSLCA